MRNLTRWLIRVAAALLIIVLATGPASADPAPSYSVSKSCAPNKVTVVEITLADYPPGSVASIEGDPVPINATTTVLITRVVILEIDAYGPEGDAQERIRPRLVSRLIG